MLDGRAISLCDVDVLAVAAVGDDRSAAFIWVMVMKFRWGANWAAILSQNWAGGNVKCVAKCVDGKVGIYLGLIGILEREKTLDYNKTRLYFDF